jgi:hypothetical protein
VETLADLEKIDAKRRPPEQAVERSIDVIAGRNQVVRIGPLRLRSG